MTSIVSRLSASDPAPFARNGRALDTREPADLDMPRADARGLVLIGCLTLLLLFGGFGLWSVMVPLRSAVVAQGVVKVISKRKAVQHLDGGILQAVLVHEGDHVEQGQVVARLDQTQIRADLGILQNKLYGELALKARLDAEKRDLPDVIFPEELLQKAAVTESALAMQTQRAEFRARKAALDGNRAVLEQQRTQQSEAIRALEGSNDGLKKQLTLLNEETRDTQFLLDKGLARKPRVLALKRGQADIEGKIAQNLASIAQAASRVAEAEQKLAQLVLDRNSDIAKQSYENEQAIADLRHRLLASRDKLERSVIRAPAAGRVVGLNTRDLTAVLAPRETLMEIVPASDRLVIEAEVNPINRDEVHAAQTARIRVLAFNMRSTPMLEGRVMMVSADALPGALERNGQPSGAGSQAPAPAYYKAEIAFATTGDTAALLGKLQPGMPTEVFIETSERTFAEYLLQPMRVAMDRAFRER